MSLAPLEREYLISPTSHFSNDLMNTDFEILNSFLEDNVKVVSNRRLIGSFFPESKASKKLEGITKIQRLKNLGLLGAIKDSEITSENYKKYLDDHFGNSCE